MTSFFRIARTVDDSFLSSQLPRDREEEERAGCGEEVGMGRKAGGRWEWLSWG